MCHSVRERALTRAVDTLNGTCDGVHEEGSQGHSGLESGGAAAPPHTLQAQPHAKG